jgi:hypothetical protein
MFPHCINDAIFSAAVPVLSILSLIIPDLTCVYTATGNHAPMIHLSDTMRCAFTCPYLPDRTACHEHFEATG